MRRPRIRSRKSHATRRSWLQGPAQAACRFGIVNHRRALALDRASRLPAQFPLRPSVNFNGDVRAPPGPSRRPRDRRLPQRIGFLYMRDRIARATRTADLDPFDIAPEPEKIVGDAAGQIEGGTVHFDRRDAAAAA